jgi:hypothetical protein
MKRTAAGSGTSRPMRGQPLDYLVDAYLEQLGPRTAAERDGFRSMDLKSAVTMAALGLRADGRRHEHLRRIPQSALEECCERLVSRLEAIDRITAFDQLLDFIETVVGRPHEDEDRVHGVNEMYYYDAACAIADQLGLDIDAVYLHRGTRQGAINLGLDGSLRSLKVSTLPAPLRRLAPGEIEDFLCVYKDEMHRFRTQ